MIVQQAGLNVIAELIMGYMYPGRPLANVTFKMYGFSSLSQSLMFLSDFKLGHYMKIPPRSMFMVQLVGTLISCCVHFGTSWWLLTTVENICNPSKLPKGSQWTCPGDDVFYNASIIWGLVSPRRMFGNLGIYQAANYFFLVGLLTPIPIWYLGRKYPEKKWVNLINMPILISGASGIPMVKSVNYVCWFAVGLYFNLVGVSMDQSGGVWS
nr:oligopeptide transporter 5-like [Ipomoea batatas]